MAHSQRKSKLAAALTLSGFVVAIPAVLVTWFVFTSSEDARLRLGVSLRGGQYLGKTGVVLQQGRYDCGAAALKMVFDHYAIDRPLADFERDLLDRPDGTSMLRLKEVAESWGFRAEGWRVSPNALTGIPLPSIALLNNRHYVVIESVESPRAIVYADPVIGRIRMPVERFWLKSNGILLVLNRQ